MLINNLFPNIDTEKIVATFRKYHIEVPESYKFADINIVIGANGSGKTRFLHAIKELYTLDRSMDVLYGYFPSLSDHKNSPDEVDDDLPESTLYDSMYMEDVSFSDFFKEIETHSEEFIPELLEYHSQRQKKRGEKALGIVQKSFLVLTGKNLVIQKKKAYVKRPDGNLELLSTALATLSPGELMLFYMSIFLAIQQNGKKNKVIILDEPESHLHPKALISFVTALTQANEFKQIWIATHSLFLVPEFQFENIVFIYDSCVKKRTSQIYQSIFSGLLGDEDGKTKMFFSSLSQWQYCEFISECFTNPTVVDIINPNDEQVLLFIQYLNSHKPFRVLDCGGGSGRLGLSLEAAEIGKVGDICYDIYDKKPTYTGNKFGVYTDLDKIRGTYNCVVMMNFLHEVEPKDWHQLFQQIYDLLEENGYLLFVEVTTLAQGEKPNDVGYLVLGKEELEILFCDNQGLFDIRYKETQKSLCTLIPRASLCNACQDTITEAIRHLEKRTLTEIVAIRKTEGEKGVTDARRYAFLSQQYINAKLFNNEERKRLSEQRKTENRKNRLAEQRSLERQVEKCLTAGRQAKRTKLIKIKALINSLEPQVSTDVSKEMFPLYYESIDSFCNTGNISDENLAMCWKYISKLERKHASKNLIATLLLALALMGDFRSENRLKNNGYIKYIPEKI